MSGFKNIGKREYFQRYGYGYGIRRAIFMLLPLYRVSDYENKKILYYRKIYSRIKRKYGKYAECDVKDVEYKVHDMKNPIWLYWKQGFENAPALVKKCKESVLKYADREVVLLTDENISEYLVLPEWILDRNRRGYLSNAALSDIIRLCLLSHYGGTWVDATVYLTDTIPQYISNSDFFAFENSVGLVHNPAGTSSWLIHAKPNNDIVRKTLNMVIAYWKKERYVNEYLLIYILINIAKSVTDLDKYWIPYASEEYSRLLFDSLGNNYNEVDIIHYKEMCKIHKLTYKINDEAINNSNSVYNALIEGKI